MTSAVDWSAWLSDFNRELLDGLDLATHSAFRHPRVTADVVERGWLGMPPATEAAIVAAEDRLGTRLPASYRSFLAASNGFLQPDLIVPRLRSADEIAWYGDLNGETAAIWAESAEPDDPLARLAGCLQVSDQELVGDAVYLLDPVRWGADGEWQAYFLASWVPGVTVYPSFFALMDTKRAEHLQAAADEELRPRPAPSMWRVLWEGLRKGPG